MCETPEQKTFSKPLEWRDWASEVKFDSGFWQVSFAIAQRWIGSATEMQQPPLDHHYWALHQGGPKRVTRTGEGRARSVDAALHAHTVVTAGSSYRWNTEGPIAFGHLYVAPADYSAFIGEAFDIDPAKAFPVEQLGVFDPLVAQLLIEILEQDRTHLDSQTAAEHFLHSLLARHFAATGKASGLSQIRLTRPVLARVIDYIAANLDGKITVADLAAVSGYSSFHFTRAFRYTTGLAPYAYIIEQRLERAKSLLAGSQMSISEIAKASGYATTAHFSTAFAGRHGAAPSDFRRARRG